MLIQHYRTNAYPSLGTDPRPTYAIDISPYRLFVELENMAKGDRILWSEDFWTEYRGHTHDFERAHPGYTIQLDRHACKLLLSGRIGSVTVHVSAVAAGKDIAPVLDAFTAVGQALIASLSEWVRDFQIVGRQETFTRYSLAQEEPERKTQTGYPISDTRHRSGYRTLPVDDGVPDHELITRI